jgi:hypothetical protein
MEATVDADHEAAGGGENFSGVRREVDPATVPLETMTGSPDPLVP